MRTPKRQRQPNYYLVFKSSSLRSLSRPILRPRNALSRNKTVRNVERSSALPRPALAHVVTTKEGGGTQTKWWANKAWLRSDFTTFCQFDTVINGTIILRLTRRRDCP
jgi:hypothetical protein